MANELTKEPQTCSECGAKRMVARFWMRNVFTCKGKPFKCSDCLLKEMDHIKEIDVYI